MFKRDDGAAEDDFVTKTNRSRKKSSKALTGTAGDDTPDTSGSSGSAATATSAAGGAAGGASGESTNISLRPRTMFSMKGRGRTDSDGSPAAYRPQWSKDGDGFVSNTPAKDADGGAADGARRKGKVLRYSKEELLALHVVTEAVPALLVEAAVASEIALDPVDSEPFDYEEVYKQWALNRNRGRGRGRTTTGTTSGTTQNSNDNGDRSRSNGKWEENKWDRSKRDQNGEDGGSWQRDTTNDSSSIWDDVGVGGSDGMEMDLSAMALAAEKFRLEMDAMRNEVEGISRGEQAEVTDMDAFDQKLEEAVKAGQFEDSDEEVQWDMPLETDAPKHLEDDSTIMFSAPAFDTKPSVRDDSAFSLSSLSDATFGLRSLAVEVEVRDEWYYLDPQGLQQGPFKTAEMREWFEAGYFKPDLPIQFGQGGVFTPLANHFVQGQIPFASIPRPSPKLTIEQEMRMREEQRLMEIHQQQQQQQRMMQLQQQQEQQRLFQFNQEEKIRLEMQRLELERQQQHHLFQQQQQHMHQQQQQQQQQQQLLLQQQSSWQRSQREGIMSALGIFGGESQIGHLHQGTSLPIQHDYRETRHMDINPLSRLHDPVYTENNHARHHDPWAGGANAQLPKEPQADHGFFSGRPLSPMKTPSPKRAENSSTVHSDPWHTESAPPSVEPTQTRSTVSPAAEQPSPVSAKTKVPSPVKEPVKSSPVKKPAESSTRPSAWGNVQQPPSNTQSLKDIQADEQQELRKNLEGERTDLAHMGAQLKMMLGVNAAQQSQPAPAPVQQPVQAPAPAHAPAPTPAPVPAPSQPTASPWGRAATAAPQLETKKSMREILEEEERLAIERAKRSEGSGVSSSHWMNVVAGTTAPAAAAPKVSRLGPVPASVLKSTTRQGRTSVGGDATAAAAAKKPAVTPGKPESDASFWNFGAAQSSKPATSSTAPSFGNGNHSSEFMSWCAKQIKSINGSDDLTLVEYCATLEDPGEIREYLAAYLGSTPRVSAFATEFIQRKRSSPKKPTTETSAASTSDFSDGAKKGKRRTKGQKIDPSLLNYSVGS